MCFGRIIDMLKKIIDTETAYMLGLSLPENSGITADIILILEMDISHSKKLILLDDLIKTYCKPIILKIVAEQLKYQSEEMQLLFIPKIIEYCRMDFFINYYAQNKLVAKPLYSVYQQLFKILESTVWLIMRTLEKIDNAELRNSAYKYCYEKLPLGLRNIVNIFSTLDRN